MKRDGFILVVEPDRELARSIELVLKSDGFKAVTARDGEEALQTCGAGLPTILITEGLLPKLDGLELAKKVRTLPNGGLVSILLMSAVYTGSKFRSQVDESGIDDVLAKPFRPEDLLKKIHALAVQIELRAERTPAAPEVFPLKGQLLEVPFIRIVSHLFRNKESGTLRLQHGTAKKLVTFEEGEPRFVVSNLERECLGQILVKKGRLTEEECQRSLEMMEQLKKRQGEALLQMGLLEPYELDEALKQQAREKFAEIFSWREGEFLFVPGKVFRKELTPVDLSVPQLCLRGVKEHYSLPVLQEQLRPFMNEAPRFRENDSLTLEEFKFATWDMKIVQQVKRGNSLSEVLGMKLARDLDVYHLFFTLNCLGMIEFPKKKQPVAPVEKAVEPSAPPEPKDPFLVLGVEPTASMEAIQDALGKKLEEAEKAKDGEDRKRSLRQAFEAIGTLEGKRDYLSRVYEKDGKLPDKAQEVFQPKEFLEVGKRFLEKKDWSHAQKVFEDAVTLFPEEGMLYCYLGFGVISMLVANKNEDSRDFTRGKRALLKGVQLAPNEAEAHYLAGRLFVAEKDYQKALTAFRRTLRIDPKFSAAASEIRVIEMRLEKLKNTSFIKWKG